MKNHKDIKKDFLDFSKNNESSPPKKLDHSILAFIDKELSPNHKLVFLKLIMIQGFVGIVSLAFCPQFNLSLTNNYEVFHYFHHTFGELICMILCGSIFVGSGAIFAAYILKESEIKKIKSSEFLYFFSLTSLALCIFLFIGAEVYFKLASVWAIGAIFSGVILFELNLFVKKTLFAH